MDGDNMGLGQTAISVCNDGNVSQLDVTDKLLGGPYYRIEVYRCSQPSGGYGVTASGSRVEFIAGDDHLSPNSNRIFRYTFSLGDQSSVLTSLPSVLEGREEFNPEGMPNGSWEVRLRDIDQLSDSYGAILRATVQPNGKGGYLLRYELRPSPAVAKTPILSPLPAPISGINPGLFDLGTDISEFPAPITVSDGTLSASDPLKDHHIEITKPMTHKYLNDSFAKIQDAVRHPAFSRFMANLDAYEEFGDFGAKPTHPGTNLVGPNAKLAAESIFVRQYRAALVLLGRLTSPEMAQGASKPLSLAQWKTNTRPGVYAIFVGAAINHIAIYKLGLDKVHSDYGGIPMKLGPGSRLEDGATPIADAWTCNQTLGEVADMLYLSEPPERY
jgi:hypothetical protein